MKVFKFGGGILHSAEAVKKIPGILAMFPGEPLIIVVSAFGKTTNALEELIMASLQAGRTGVRDISEILKIIILKSFQGFFADAGHPVYSETRALWDELEEMILQATIFIFS